MQKYLETRKALRTLKEKFPLILGDHEKMESQILGLDVSKARKFRALLESSTTEEQAAEALKTARNYKSKKSNGKG